MLIQATQLLADWLDERHGLDSCDIEPLPASDILAPDHIVPAHHVALRLGKPGPVAVIGLQSCLRRPLSGKSDA